MESVKMDHSEVQTEWEKPADNNLSNMTGAEMKALLEYRSELFESVAIHYQEFVKAIHVLPIHVIKRQMAFQNIDQGWHWVKDGLDDVWETPADKEKKMAQWKAEQEQKDAKPNEKA